MSSRRREARSIYLDESVDAESVALALREAGATVERARDHFPRGTPDQNWLESVGRRGWIVLTRDKRIRHRELELDSLVEAKVRAFVFVGGNVAIADTAAALAKALPKILNISVSEPPPFIYNLGRSGRLVKIR